jgi:trehalose 6-phosphate phosphatase
MSMAERLAGSGQRARLSSAEAISLAAATSSNCGFFFDFDGTLAAIEEDPTTVQPVAGAVPALASLARLVRKVGIVSARPVSFLHSRLSDAGPLTLYGLYGLEWQRDGEAVETDQDALSWVARIRDLTERARCELPPSVRVEDKRLSVALHFRAAPQFEPDVQDWSHDQETRYGLVAQHGRMVVELRPPIRRDKGDVVRGEIGDLVSAWYFGDDLSDLEAFHALAEREAAGDGFIGVRVAVANTETGDLLASNADFVVGAPVDVPVLLTTIAAAIRG